MGRKVRAALGVATIVSAVTTGVAVAGPGAASPIPMLLTAADLPGASVVPTTVQPVRTIFLPRDHDFDGSHSARRQFAFATPYGAGKITEVAHEVTVLQPSGVAGVIRGLVVYSLGRALNDAGEPQRLAAFVGRPGPATNLVAKQVDVGEDAIEISFTVNADAGPQHVTVVVYSVANLLETITTVGTADASADALALARLAERRRSAASGPAAVSPPRIQGTPRRGKTLAAFPGRWTRQPDGFDFQWLRCDPKGAHCVAIPGADGVTYVVARTDLGNTLRVRVVASNAAGSGEATSAPTAVVR